MARTLTIVSLALLLGCTGKVDGSGGGAGGSSGGGSATGGGSGGGVATGGGAAAGGGSATGGGAATGGGGAATGGGSATGGGGGGSTDAGSYGPTFGAFIGLNAFIDDPVPLLAAIGNVREYHSWQWCEGNGDSSYPGYPNNQNSFVMFGGYWNWDTYYSDLADAGVFGYPVIQAGVSFVNNGAVPPVPADAGLTDPASYIAHADHMFQYAARYGRTSVADAKLKLAADQTRVSALGSVQYIEDFNEQDATWVLPGGAYLFPPDVYAAMASADYDGDQQRLGTTVGIKNADPTMKMVMGGLAGKGNTFDDWEQSCEDYISGVQTWADAHRGGSFPGDVLNVHHYDFGPDGFGVPNPRPAVSPEDDAVVTKMKKLVAYRDAHYPGKELWITEFGYDTDSMSNLRSPPIGSNSAGIVQGQWLIRSYLALMEAGFDRAFVFVSRDGCTGSNCHVQFDTSGLTGVKGDWTPKPAYYFIATLRSRLAPFALAGVTSQGGVKIAKAVDVAGNRTAWILWSPTSMDTKVTGYSLDVGTSTSVKAVRLVDQQLSGMESTLTVSSNHVTLDVDETPVLVIAN